jgi:hypothetical protein
MYNTVYVPLSVMVKVTVRKDMRSKSFICYCYQQCLFENHKIADTQLYEKFFYEDCGNVLSFIGYLSDDYYHICEFVTQFRKAE